MFPIQILILMFLIMSVPITFNYLTHLMRSLSPSPNLKLVPLFPIFWVTATCVLHRRNFSGRLIIASAIVLTYGMLELALRGFYNSTLVIIFSLPILVFLFTRIVPPLSPPPLPVPAAEAHAQSLEKESETQQLRGTSPGLKGEVRNRGPNDQVVHAGVSKEVRDGGSGSDGG
jgi:hypothetical protein